MFISWSTTYGSGALLWRTSSLLEGRRGWEKIEGAERGALFPLVAEELDKVDGEEKLLVVRKVLMSHLGDCEEFPGDAIRCRHVRLGTV